MTKRFVAIFAAVLLMVCATTLQAEGAHKTLIVTMTNDPVANEIIVLDAATHARLQTLSTNGKGGVGGNARGVKQYNGQLFAAVNNGSGNVALFSRAGDRLIFEQSVATTSSPVSIDFANGHMYVAGTTSVDSFAIRGNHVGALDGTTGLVLFGGALPPNGSTAQVAAAGRDTLLVTLKTDPIPGTVDVITLNNDGAISGWAAAVSAPSGTLTPFGFSTYPDGTALITLAHSGHDGLFRNGAFTAIVNSAGQGGNCWTTRIGKYVLIVNTGSRTITRALGTGSNIFLDTAVAASITTGGAPTDIDADNGYLAVIDRTGGAGATSHVTVFSYNAFAELAASGAPVDLGVTSANGVAVMGPIDREN